MALTARQHRLVARYVARLESAVAVDEEQLVSAFLAGAGRNSPFTRLAYERDLAAFRRFLETRDVGLLEVTADDVAAFVAALDGIRPPLKSSTINRRLYVLRAAYRDFAERHPELELPNPVRRRHLRRRERRLPRPIGDAVVEKLLAGVSDPRDQALFQMYLATGLRLRALLALDIGDLEYREVEIHGRSEFCGSIVARDKGGDERQVYFTAEAWTALERYLKRRRDLTSSAPLFTNRRGARLSARGAEHRLAYWCAKLGLEPLQIHRFRHTLATRLLQRGMPLERLQQLLGHRQITTTLNYAAVSDLETRASYIQASPRARRRRR